MRSRQAAYFLMAICAAAVSFLTVMDMIAGGGHAAPLGASQAEAILYLHIPDKMIAGQTYHGVAVTDRPAPFGAISDRTVHLATGSVSVSIPATAVIPPGMNHGVFEIKAVRSGPAEVHATHAGDVGLSGGTVFSPSAGPRSLDLVMPGNVTSAPDITAVVVVLDGNGYPVQAVRDTDVRIVASGMIGAPQTVLIAEGRTHAALRLQVNGSGSVTAAAAGLEVDTEHIAYDRDAVTVHIAAVPDVVLQGGVIHYTIWMEKGGNYDDDYAGDGPFHPPRAIRGEIHTTDVDVVRLTESVPANKDAGFGTVVVRNGVAQGVAYAGLEPGHAILTATIPGYGVASVPVCVGAVVFGDAKDNNGDGGGGDTLQASENGTARDTDTTGADSTTAAVAPVGCGGGKVEMFREYAQRIVDEHARVAIHGGHQSIPQLPRELPEQPPTNHIRFWVYPDVTGHVARGTVGFYHLETETVHTVTYDENGTRIDTESEYTRLIPARTDYHHVTVAAPHKDVLVQPVHVAHPTRYTNAYDFPIAAGREGTYDIGVTSGGHTATGTLRVAAPYEAGYRLQLVPVPAALGAAQPLYVASITDGKGRILDVHDEFGRDRTVSVAFGDGRVENVMVGESPSSSNTAVIYGTVAGETGVVATLEGSPGAAGPAYGTVTPGGVPVSIEMAVPSIVHSGEDFPVAIHTVDPFGIPVERVDAPAPAAKQVGGDMLSAAAVAATGFLYHNGTAAAVSGAGSHLVGILHSLGGGIQEEIVSFLNLMNLTADAPPRVAAGKPFEIRVTSSPAAASDALLPAGGNSYGDGGAASAAHSFPHVSYEVADSPWPVEQTAPGVFRVTPATPGYATITVQGHMDGFEPGTVSVPVHSEMAVRLKVDAVSEDGGSGLEIQFSLRNGTALVTPFEATLRHPEHLRFGFPDTLDSGYGLLDVSYGGGGGYLTDEDGDGTYDGVRVVPGDDSITVTATYERSVQVFVNGGSGGGIYPYGADVQVRAEPGHVVPYLVPERLAYWEGAPGRPSSFVMEAHRDVEMTAVYEPDYARVLYVILAGTAAAAGYVAYRRAGSRISYVIGGALDGMVRAGREVAPRAAAAARGRSGEEGRRKDDYE
ncbi:MAG: hypothetical protein OXP12_07330 [Thaumarchaeota archaeon]|nr:hypothetical protein [Nitrososphaerota archaeon]